MPSTPQPRTVRHAAGSAAGPSWPTSGLGFTGLALGAMLHRDGVARADAPPPGAARRPAALRAEGEERHLDLPLRRRQPPGDLRPQAGPEQVRRQDLRRDAASPTRSSRRCSRKRSRAVVGESTATRTRRSSRSRSASRSTARAGIEISDWWPHLAGCVDDIAFVRSMYTTDNDHAAEFQMHNGRHKLDERQPVIGSWIHYGLGTPQREPAAVRLPRPVQGPAASSEDFAADYLGPQHAGVELSLDPANPLPFGTRGPGRPGRGAGATSSPSSAS